MDFFTTEFYLCISVLLLLFLTVVLVIVYNLLDILWQGLTIFSVLFFFWNILKLNYIHFIWEYLCNFLKNEDIFLYKHNTVITPNHQQ